MSSFKSYWSSLKYHSITRPSITLATHGIKKIGSIAARKYALHRHAQGKGRKPGLRQAILNKTRGDTANNPRLWSKTTEAGKKRRAEAAKSIKSSRKPAPAPSPKPSIKKGAPLKRSAPHTEVSQAVKTSQNYGQLRRKLTGQAVRKVSASVIHKSHGPQTRLDRANQLRAYRHISGSKLKSVVRHTKNRLQRKAAKMLAPKGK